MSERNGPFERAVLAPESKALFIFVNIKLAQKANNAKKQ